MKVVPLATYAIFSVGSNANVHVSPSLTLRPALPSLIYAALISILSIFARSPLRTNREQRVHHPRS